MLKNYITIALRNLMKHKLYSAINVLGLALGMASCVLMILFVRDELSFDKHFENVDDLHRIQLTYTRPNGHSIESAASVIPALRLLQDEVEGIEDTTYVYARKSQVNVNDRSGIVKINYVAPNFFSMFAFPFSKGDAVRALDEPNTAVISAKLAKSLYPDSDPMGREFFVTRQRRPVTITGVLSADQPNTHFKNGIFVSRETIADGKWCGGEDNWKKVCAYTYFKLRPGATTDDIESALARIVAREVPPMERLGRTWPGEKSVALSTIPVKQIHLQSKRHEEMKAGGDKSLVYVFSFLSLLILVIACINFTNLATARATDRSREISIRKIVGAERRQIIAQILGESILLAFLALVIAVSLVELLLPSYNAVIGKELTFSYASDIGLMATLLALSVVVGFIGGVYPALFLSSFKPVTISKGTFANVDRHLLFRSTLVVIQFAISIGLMSATFVVYSQMNFSKNQALQFDRESILAIRLLDSKDDDQKVKQLMAVLGEVDGIESLALSNLLPNQATSMAIVRRPGFEGNELKAIAIASVAPAFFDIYGIDIVEGRNFSMHPDFYDKDVYKSPSKSEPETLSHGIINEASLAYLGFESAQDALGKTFDVGEKNRSFVSHVKIIGVVPDANFASTRQAVGPMVYQMDPKRFYALSLKLDGDKTWDTVKWVKKSWELFYPDKVIELEFVDESYDELYAQETTRGYLFAGFSLLAMFIACLGLYGLASVAAERRTQEIGLRKVMGASVFDIVKLLVWQFSRPVLMANLIAWPIAFWAMKVWLGGFAMHIELTPTAFLLSSLITLVVAFATVTWHARKVAMAKPAETLRYE